MRYAGRTPCGVLGVAEGASFTEVKKAYLRRARATHPDVPGGSSEAFREVQTAFDALKRRAPAEETPPRRSRSTPYDAWLIRPRVARHWAEDDPVLRARSPLPASTRRATFAELLSTELRHLRTDAA